MASVETTFSQQRTEDSDTVRQIVPAETVLVTTSSNRHHSTVQEVGVSPELIDVGELTDDYSVYIQNLDDTNNVILLAGAAETPFAVIRPGNFCYVPLKSLASGGSEIKAQASAFTVRMLLVCNEITS